ncbi:hypothetical protein Tco_0655430 [Tanacetum coccineum]|uniref:Uncharacterized protein n=1 Tax=Tanacetum coccineum TaxID=301880 RepID=A0ABQ4X731_9ASTR
MAEQDIPPPTITAMKIPIIRKGEYDIWSMRMRQYICHTDHNLWDVIVNGDLEEEPAPTGETSAPPAPKTAKQLAARRNQERVKSILLLAIPDEYLLKFHNVADAKSLWEAIKSRSSDEESTPEMIGLDEYAIRKKIIESKTTKLNADTSKSKTSETVGNTNEVNVEKPKSVNESVVSTPNINKDKVIIEDWNSDDENDVSEVSPVKTNETQIAKTQVDKIGQTSKKAGIGFKKIKACFVCKSTDHLIKDCNFYNKKSPEPKLKNVVNTGQRVVKPVWDNAKRVNHQKISNKLNYPQARRTFVPLGVLTRIGLVNPARINEKIAVQTINTARPVSTARSVSTARPFAPKTAQTSSDVRPIYPRMDNVRPKASYSPIKMFYYTKPTFRPKNLKQDVKTFGVQNMTTAETRAVVNTGKGKMDTDLKKSRIMQWWIVTEDAHDEGTVKDNEETRVSTEDQASTDKPKVSTNKLKVSIDKPNEGTAEPKDGNSDESATPTTIFRDDETIAQFLPLPKIDPKDKGKKVLEEKVESDAELEGVNEAEKKFKMLANDEEIARKVQEEWEAKEEKKKLAEEEATKATFTNEYDFFKKDLMQTRFLLRSFKKKREKSSPLSKEPSFFMIPLLHKEDFLLNKDLRLSETSFLQEIS